MKRKTQIMLIILIALVTILILSIPSCNAKQENEDYTQNIRSATVHMMMASTEARLLGQQIGAGTLAELSRENKDSISQKQQRADDLMASLPTPNRRNKAAFDALQKLHTAYDELVDLTLSGDKTALANGLDEAQNKVAEAYQRLEIFLK